MNEGNKSTAFSFEEFKVLETWYSALDDKDFSDFELKVEFGATGKFGAVGKYDPERAMFGIIFEFGAYWSKEEERAYFIKVGSIANFSFDHNITLETIPDYFYANAVAIAFPYLRAFIATMTLQAGQRPFVLPLMNLSNIGEDLKNNITSINPGVGK